VGTPLAADVHHSSQGVLEPELGLLFAIVHPILCLLGAVALGTPLPTHVYHVGLGVLGAKLSLGAAIVRAE